MKTSIFNTVIRDFQVSLFRKANIEPYTGVMFSAGNSKLPKNCMVVNLSSAANCMSDALHMCEHSSICYAKKIERLYTNYRLKNEKIDQLFSRISTAEIEQLIELYLDAYMLDGNMIKQIRVSEAGEIRSMDDIEMLNRIQERHKAIVVYTYSARTDLDFSKAKFIVSGSNESVKGVSRWFKAVDKTTFENLPKGSLKCKGSGGCKICNLCYNPKVSGIVYAKIH